MYSKLETNALIVIIKCVIKDFSEKYPDAEQPTRHTLANLNKKFEQTGSVVDLPRSGRPKSVTNKRNLQAVADAMGVNPKKSMRTVSKEIGISKSSMLRIIKELNLK